MAHNHCMRRRHILVRALVLLTAVGVVAGCGRTDAPTAPPTPPSQLAPTAPAAAMQRACGQQAYATAPRHVIWIWLENKAFDEVVAAPGSRVARANRFLNEVVARRCATLTRFDAVQHASLGNYIAAATGSPAGIDGGCAPSQCPIDRDSVFGQVARAGGSWRSYQESAPGNCTRSDVGRYVVRHDPVPYLVRETADCRRWDQPLGTPTRGPLARQLDTGTLADLTFVTADVCDDSHDCPAHVADAWLASWVGRIAASKAYAAGDVLVLLVWDEGNRRRGPGIATNSPCPRGTMRGDCRAPAFVIGPAVAAGRRIATQVDHYALLQLTQELLGVGPRLGPDRGAAVAELRAAVTPKKK